LFNHVLPGGVARHINRTLGYREESGLAFRAPDCAARCSISAALAKHSSAVRILATIAMRDV
jgi:hypothetical protein